MRLLAALGLLMLVAVLGAAAYAWLGYYDVAASDPHFDPVRWSLDTTMVRSVEQHAEAQVGAVPSLAEPSRIQTGAEHYLGEGCVTCHGAPGFEPAGFAAHMRPEPPMLAQAASAWSDAQLFWIVKHGIKMSGMPAFGATHEDAELWALVAFVRRLPELSAAEVEELVAAGDHHRQEGAEADGEPADGAAAGAEGDHPEGDDGAEGHGRPEAQSGAREQ